MKTNQAGHSCDMLQSQRRWPLFSFFARSDCPSMTSQCNAKGRLCPQVPFSKLPHENAFLYSVNRGNMCLCPPMTLFSSVCVRIASRSVYISLVFNISLRRRLVPERSFLCKLLSIFYASAKSEKHYRE